MQASVYHLQLNVRDAATALPFYRALLGDLDYRVTYEQPGVLAMSNGSTDFWLIAAPADRRRHAPHRKNPGLNHVALRVASRGDVERFHAEFLKARGIPTLYARGRPHPMTASRDLAGSRARHGGGAARPFRVTSPAIPGRQLAKSGVRHSTIEANGTAGQPRRRAAPGRQRLSVSRPQGTPSS